ncbi:MAG TPA: hypothetical protein VF331_04085 [Polyangiales bacterium]
MAQGTPSFMQRMLIGKVLGELVEFLPEAARDALVDVREYVREHGRLPKFEPVRTQLASAGQTLQAVSVHLGGAPAGAALHMINVLKGDVTGALLRGVNVVIGDVQDGTVRGTNVLLGAVRGGELRGVNVVIGDVHGGELRSVYVILGNVYGGDVRCQVLVGDVHGGKVVARVQRGKVLGGDAQIERTVD